MIKANVINHKEGKLRARKEMKTRRKKLRKEEGIKKANTCRETPG